MERDYLSRILRAFASAYKNMDSESRVELLNMTTDRIQSETRTLSEGVHLTQVRCNERRPEKSGWYDTDKASLYWFDSERTWSCRDDRISDEYPLVWYEPLSIPEQPAMSEWKYTDKRSPNAYQDGDWDGLKSDDVIAEAEDGTLYIAHCYVGYMDGSGFCDWFGNDSYSINKKIIRWCEIPK